jgi:hypothetical protein
MPAGLSMKELTIRTTRRFPPPAAKAWSLICNSRMDGSSTLLFKLGVPQPLRCEIPEGQGGVGCERECVSDQGVVHQRILIWEPEKCLSFRMERTDLSFQRYVREIVERFDLVATYAGVEVTRTTRVWTKGRWQPLKQLALFVSLKQVHQYVFQNWLKTAKLGATRPESTSPTPT